MNLSRTILYFIIFMIIPGIAIEEANISCTAVNHKTNEHVDLQKLRKTEKNGYNWEVKDEENKIDFKINICAPIMMNDTSIEGVNLERVGAIYVEGNETFSIGEMSSNVYFQGEKVVLQYKNGSLCPGNTTFRKSSTISFICNPRIYDKPVIFFVAEADKCAYFFEWHTAYACTKAKEHLFGPGTIFGIILLVTLIVYCIGSCIYRNTTIYATGWRQIPRHGVFFTIKDTASNLFTSLFSKLNIFKFMQSDYSYIGDIDEENRLIDEVFVNN
ncbi:hypothetical protein T552_00138 [Pneumocystis carinii B80]|uniref:MRH domain-containing protein n=1 Tax=Pneumocystis carinii (strain B80) TaxID=1408658 RepID=A0A0W4ZSZ2_PNEC8|nr:hypothetical protein T552_00138 [Pneumocystis carinii B80]KTW31496.1 hypothetical protein T552_00138 [Pneumocystis carinii B80]